MKNKLEMNAYLTKDFIEIFGNIRIKLLLNLSFLQKLIFGYNECVYRTEYYFIHMQL